jgi:hypothetical protein
MGNPYVYWGLLALILVALGLIAFSFTRLVFRLAALAAVIVVVFRVTWLGLEERGHPHVYYRAFVQGGDHVARVMLRPLLPDSVTRNVAVGRVGWIVLLVALLGLLAGLDMLSVRREQPRVSIPPAPGPEPGDPNVKDRRALTEKLQFVLPTVDVRRPAAMPGATALDSLASVAATSGEQGSGLAAAVIQLVQALQARPRTYEVRVFSERCEASGQIKKDGGRRRITVEVRERRTGRSIAVQILQPCDPDETAAKVAGYTARQIFRHDPATPAWATGSFDGADLCAYLLARQTCPAGRTYRDWCECREKRRRMLERVVGPDQGAGVVGYELAALCEQDENNLKALMLHLSNREHYPGFWRGRYRLATSMSMLAGPLSDTRWPLPDDGRWPGLDASTDGRASPNGQAAGPGQRDLAGLELARLRRTLVRQMSFGGLLGQLTPEQDRALAGSPPADGRQARLALLRVALGEMTACWRHRHACVLLWTALRSRPIRSASLAELGGGPPHWWRHPRRRLWSLVFAREIAQQRIRALEQCPAHADVALCQLQSRARRRLRLPGPVAAGTQSSRARRHPRRTFGGGGWDFNRATWQAVYNAACLHALPRADGSVTGDAAQEAVQLLRLAISAPGCELARPSERIATDPDLYPLRDCPVFDEFVREQAAADFAPSWDNEIGDPWFRERLPRPEISVPPPGGGSPPDGGGADREFRIVPWPRG